MFYLPRKSFLSSVFKFSWEDPGGGGASPLFKPYEYVPPQRVRFLRRFWSENRYRLCPFSLESGLNFEKTTGVYERIHPFNSR